MQVLITGASGRLGRVLRAQWADRNDLGFDPVWCSRHPAVDSDVHWDILSDDPPTLPKGAIILHLAGVLRGDRLALSQNALMALAICRAAKATAAAHIFLPSSAAVYGKGQCDHVEVHAPDPRSDYGQAKLDMEREALTWAQNEDQNTPNITCLRIGNVLGADKLFGGLDTGNRVVLDAIPDQVGGPIRSYIGPRAFARTVASLVMKAGSGVALPKILNIASTGAVSMADLLIAAERPYSFGKPRTDAIPKVSLSTKRLELLVPSGPVDAPGMIADWKCSRTAVL
jgi:nucleoside-diphosphate-sugar epimerase